MKTHLLAICLALAVLGVVPLSAETGPKNGFRDLLWGDPPTKDMVPVPPRGVGPLAGLDSFLRREDNVVLNREAAFIVYGFFKGGFCRVIVSWEGNQKDLEQITTLLGVAWGSPGDVFAGVKRVWLSGTRGTLAVLHEVEPPNTTVPRWSRQLVISDTACAKRMPDDTGL